MKPVYVLFFLVLAAPFLALLPTEQDPDAVNWAEAMEKAATSRRYGLRLAAARKIAAAGAPAVPAIEAFAKKNGRNALPAAIVDSIAKAKTTEDAVVDQLLRWARDRDFYWRNQAFLGLALRATSLPDRKDELVELFSAHRDDPAWLVATHARLGLHLLDAGNRDAGPDDDPRLASTLTGLLLENGQQPPLQPLLDALADERTFLGSPWAQYQAQAANRVLQRALGDAHPGAREDKSEALVAMRDAIQAKFDQTLELPTIKTDPLIPIAGGFEVLSCRNGDLFVQWTTDGRIYEGIDTRLCVQLPTSIWDRLAQERAALPLSTNLGAVICDKMRLKWASTDDGSDLHINVAPTSLPKPAADWLLEFARALEEADKLPLATAVRSAVEQFASR